MATVTETRPKRTPVSGWRNVLTFKDKEPGYFYRWVNDTETRLDVFKAAGYEPVVGNSQVGDKRVGTASQLGSVISKPVGNGIVAVLMRIKQEWYDEDQEAKLARVRSIESDIQNTGNKNGWYGDIKTER